MTSPILATEATLRTFSVRVQAIVIDGKQMTLSVFRQLPVADAVDDELQLKPYRFWGKVRYSIKDEGDLWAVADREGELVRCEIAVKRLRFEAGTLRKAAEWDERVNQKEKARDRRMRAESLDRLRKVYEQLDALLPQLFIAV